MIDPGTIIEAIGVRDGDQFNEVLVPFLALRKHEEMVIPSHAVPEGMPPGINVEFAPNDGLDSHLAAGFVEFDRPVKGTVIGERHGGTPPEGCPPGEVPTPDCPVQEAVFTMHVEMNKGSFHCSAASPSVSSDSSAISSLSTSRSALKVFCISKRPSCLSSSILAPPGSLL